MIPRAASSIALVFTLVVGGAAGTGCMPDIEEDSGEPADRVKPVFDAEAATIPLPNDAALNERGTLRKSSFDGIDREDATGEFLRWLTSLHGWVPSASIEVPLDGKLDEETVGPGAVRLFRIGDEGSTERLEVEEVRYEETNVEVSTGGEIQDIEGSRLTIVPKKSLSTHREYAAAVTKELKDPDGRSIVEPRPIFFAASEEPLVDENGEKTIESLPDDRTAQQLENLRKSLRPVFETLNRANVAVAFRWTTVRDPQTILDPESGTIPQPNTAATDEEGRPLERAFDSIGEETAQAHFEEYLTRLRGWPMAAPIELPIAGKVKTGDESGTVGPETVQLWRFVDPEDPEAGLEQVELESIDYDSETGRVSLTPKQDLKKRQRFLAFATNEIEGPEGYSLKLPAALKMAIQPHPVLEDGASTVARISDEQARQIEQLRSFLQPAVEAVEAETDLERGEIGAIWTWETWKDTFAVFDPSAGDIPFPNEFVRRGEEGRVTLPTEGLSSLQQAIVGELNTRRGFSTTAPGWIRFDGPIDPDTVSRASVPLLWRGSGTPFVYEESRYELNYRSDWNRLITQPVRPWNRDDARDPTADAKLNLALITKSVKDTEGRSVMPSPAFVFLRSPEPLYADGSSTVDQLGNDAAQQLEQARKSFNTLFRLAPAIEDVDIEKREDLALAYGFHPENPVQTLQELRAQAVEKVGERGSISVGRACEANGNCGSDPNEVSDPGSNYTGPNGTTVDMPNVQRIQWAAEFDTVRFTKSDGSLADYSGASPETVGASVFLPKDSQCPGKNPNADQSEGFDVVIAQHGLGGSRVQSGMALANALAGECLAVVATDFPKHGGRAAGAGSLHPPYSNPEMSGANFFSTDLRATKNNLLQSAVDVAVLGQIIQEDALEAAIDDDTNTDYFDYSGDREVGYIGLSLGGFVGLPTATVDSNISVGVFTAVGGGYADVLVDGTLGGDILNALEQAGLEEGTFGRFRALAFIQWVAEHVDPLAFAPFLAEDPLEELGYDASNGSFSKGDTMAGNEAMVQMATDPNEGDDPVVPNATTERLADSAGLSLSETTYEASHGFLFDTEASNDEADCARRQAAKWLASGIGGEASYPDRLKPSNCTD